MAPLHSNVDAQTVLLTLVKQAGYYAVAYLSVDNAMKVTKKTKGWISIAHKKYPSTFVQLLPNIDPETQRAKVLFSITDSPSNLLLGAFTQMDISIAPYTDAIMVKKSALSLFKGDWVVFVEKEHEEEAHHDEKSDHDHDDEKAEHDDHDHDAHTSDKGHDEHADHDEEEEGHGEHGGHEEHEEAPYAAKVVEIIAYAGNYVAIKGLKADEEYVSDGVYFVKSMILKSSLGEHGH